MSSNTREKNDLIFVKDEIACTPPIDSFDTVCGEISLSLQNPETPCPEQRFDTCDTDIKSHITAFLNNLPVQLNLQQLQELTLTNPGEALTVLNEVRQEVESQLHKARMLKQLYWHGV